MKVTRLCILLGSLIAPLHATAQPVTRPADVDAQPGLGVEVTAIDAEVDPTDVRAAIAADLGIAVTDGAAFAPALGRLEIAVGDGVIRIAYHPSAGTVIERRLALPVAPEERVELIAFVATNLVRDQVGEILDGLRATPAPEVVIPPVRAPVAGPRPAPTVTRTIPVTVGFVPPLAVDRVFGERIVVGVGVHALVGMTHGSRFASISGLVDVQRDFASGAQIGGLVASAGRLDEGVQIAGLAAISRGNAEGAQIAGLAAVARGNMKGAQIAGIGNATKQIEGLQIAGIANVAGRVEGVQIGGVANVGGDVKGVQIGVVNVAKRMRGVQLGVVNLSDDGDDAIPIGVINYAKNGRLAAEGWVDSSRISAAGIRHGTKHVHNIWSVGWSPDYDHVLVGAGLGVHFGVGQGVGLDIDAMHWMTNVWNAEFSQISQARLGLAAQLGSLEVFGGVAANVYVADGMDESTKFHPVYERRTTTSEGDAVVAWPSAFAGIRLRAR